MRSQGLSPGAAPGELREHPAQPAWPWQAPGPEPHLLHLGSGRSTAPWLHLGRSVEGPSAWTTRGFHMASRSCPSSSSRLLCLCLLFPARDPHSDSTSEDKNGSPLRHSAPGQRGQSAEEPLPQAGHARWALTDIGPNAASQRALCCDSPMWPAGLASLLARSCVAPSVMSRVPSPLLPALPPHQWVPNPTLRLQDPHPPHLTPPQL